MLKSKVRCQVHPPTPIVQLTNYLIKPFCQVHPFCSLSTWLLDVQFARADAVDELGGLRGGAIRLNQQVFVEVTDPAASLQLWVGGCLCTLSLSSALGVEVHQVLQRAPVGSFGDG